ncbi:ABC transporter substrate-binding protein [Microbacterium soli]|uniref:ABC transporter substrate-binding protein n=1 Tax=Microbacterium soli TaxID=446075 RepID=A0ABP7NN56_9MICO
MSRNIKGSALILVPLLALTGCAGLFGEKNTEQGDRTTLTFASYGGPLQDQQIIAWEEPYMELHDNVDFINTSPSDPAQIQAMVEAGKPTWDVADISPYFATEFCGVYLEELDLNIDRSQFEEETIGECGMPAERFGLLFLYNIDTYGDAPPTRTADFFDLEKFPGKRALTSSPRDGMLETALLASGVAPDDLYPLDVDRALETWEGVRDDTIFAANNGALLQLIVDGQVDMALIVTGRAAAAIEEGANFAPVWDTTVTNYAVLVVPKGSPNKEEAMRFIEFATSVEPAAEFAELSTTAPSNLEAVPEYTELQSMLDVFGPANTGSRVAMDATWWSQNYSEMTDRFNTWLAG